MAQMPIFPWLDIQSPLLNEPNRELAAMGDPAAEAIRQQMLFPLKAGQAIAPRSGTKEKETTYKVLMEEPTSFGEYLQKAASMPEVQAAQQGVEGLAGLLGKYGEIAARPQLDLSPVMRAGDVLSGGKYGLSEGYKAPVGLEEKIKNVIGVGGEIQKRRAEVLDKIADMVKARKNLGYTVSEAVKEASATTRNEPPPRGQITPGQRALNLRQFHQQVTTETKPYRDSLEASNKLIKLLATPGDISDTAAVAAHLQTLRLSPISNFEFRTAQGVTTGGEIMNRLEMALKTGGRITDQDRPEFLRVARMARDESLKHVGEHRKGAGEYGSALGLTPKEVESAYAPGMRSATLAPSEASLLRKAREGLKSKDPSERAKYEKVINYFKKRGLE